MARSNVEATTIIMDISSTTVFPVNPGGTDSFFDETINFVNRLIERKIFSRPSDLISVVLLGTKETINNMAEQGMGYEHISIATELINPSWDLIQKLKNKTKVSMSSTGDWVDSLVVAADHLHTELSERTGKISSKKVILLTNFRTKTSVNREDLEKIVETYKNTDIELIFIGPKIWTEEDDDLDCIPMSEEQIDNSKIVQKIIDELDCVACTFEEANAQIKFHKKKAVNAHPWYADLCIGPNIKIPVAGYKRTDVTTSKKWEYYYKSKDTKTESKTEKHPAGDAPEAMQGDCTPQAIERIRQYFLKDDNMVTVKEEDVVCGFAYGKTVVPYTQIDKSMEYKSGTKGLIVYGFTKLENIQWSHLSEDGIRYIAAKKDHINAKLALEALITSLKDSGFVIIARKVYAKDYQPRMVVLFPIVKKAYKCLSMITLAFREDHNYMAFPGLDQKKNSIDDEQKNAVDALIKAMDLSLRDENRKEIFSIETAVNSTIQYTFDCLSFRALNPDEPLPPPRPDVQKLLQTPASVAKLASEPLQNIRKLFPLNEIVKNKSGKHWVNQHLKNDVKDVKMDIADDSKTSAAAVLGTQITKIRTISPAEDFKELLKSGVPFTTVFEQCTEVVENLVMLAFGDDFIKPISTIKVMRDECIVQNPSIYNDWLVKFKSSLLEKFKVIFFKRLIDNRLGLISVDENSTSAISVGYAQEFENVAVSESISKPNTTDADEIDELFG